jgi:acyl-CoA synthetase (AMP-forming)/AMP-acid ligase II
MPRGQEGILRIRTPGMIHGYLDNPGQTRASFHDGWFYPGDIGTVTEDGILVLKGRTSQVINTGLVKVSPHWIDDVLHDFPGVVEAASFGVPDTDGVPVIWAAIVAETPIDIASLQRFCHGRLGPLASPRSVIQLSELPFNASGKVAIGDLVALASRQCGAVQPIGRR